MTVVGVQIILIQLCVFCFNILCPFPRPLFLLYDFSHAGAFINRHTLITYSLIVWCAIFSTALRFVVYSTWLFHAVEIKPSKHSAVASLLVFLAHLSQFLRNSCLCSLSGFSIHVQSFSLWEIIRGIYNLTVRHRPRLFLLTILLAILPCSWGILSSLFQHWGRSAGYNIVSPLLFLGKVTGSTSSC